eukprot:gene12434-13598_t
MGDKLELPNIEDETKEEDTGILRFLKRRYLTEIEVVLFESEGFDIYDNIKILPVEYTVAESKQSEKNFPSLNGAVKKSVSFLQVPTSEAHNVSLPPLSPRSRKSISAQISEIFSSAKLLLPLPADRNSEAEECEQNMMILAAGGLLDQEAEASLKHHLGFDLESSEVEEQRISLPEKVEKI